MHANQHFVLLRGGRRDVGDVENFRRSELGVDDCFHRFTPCYKLSVFKKKYFFFFFFF